MLMSLHCIGEDECTNTGIVTQALSDCVAIMVCSLHCWHGVLCSALLKQATN